VSDATNTGGTALGVPALMLAIAATGRADADPEAVVVPSAHPAAVAATAAARAAARKNLIRL
jgi:hypothetical protein